MTRVIGIGGVFFRSRQPAALAEWYSRHLGIDAAHGVDGTVWWQDAGPTAWAPVPADARDFVRPEQAFMVNFRVDDLDGVLRSLRANGVAVEDEIEELEYGRFGWAVDPDGNRFELWEPPPGGLKTVRQANDA